MRGVERRTGSGGPRGLAQKGQEYGEDYIVDLSGSLIPAPWDLFPVPVDFADGDRAGVVEPDTCRCLRWVRRSELGAGKNYWKMFGFATSLQRDCERE